MKKHYQSYLVIACLLLIGSLFIYTNNGEDISNNIDSIKSEKNWSTKKTKVKSGKDAFMKPDGFIEYYNSISKKINENTSGYDNGYKFSELSKSLELAAKARKANLDVEFISRGPGNVGGRTRAIAIDIEDDTHCTWFAGAASGGLWKTTDCGDTWENISPNVPNLSTNSIAQATSNPDVLYVGTGEVFAGNATFVRGDGIYKSVDKGATWNLLPSTIGNDLFESVNRIKVDPVNEDVVVIATNEGIFKSLDGGTSWNEQYSFINQNGEAASVQDLQVDPNDFSTQYAGVNGLGIVKSTDGGDTWMLSSDGITAGVRFEVTVAPSNTDYIYTSTFQAIPGSETPATVVYASRDKGASWVRVQSQEGFDDSFLGNQGWYDNSIAVNPYDENEVFVGGVSIGKYKISADLSTENSFKGLDIEGTEFISFVPFGAQFNGGTIDIASGDNSPSQNPVTVELRFGGANSQKAHRFTIPDGETSGVPIADYSYQDYVDVPFEAWDIVNNRQLMVSFRDQENNGVFNLNKRSESDETLSDAREYLYIHDVEYDASAPNASIGVNGGVEFANMYYCWPVLAEDATWEPINFVNSVLRFNYGEQNLAISSTSAVYDAYGSYQNQNTTTLHPDHHNLTFVKMDDATETFRIINGNDGGFGFSENNGDDFVEKESGYVTSQFYGADKKPGEDKYIGGMQDNGTYISSGTEVDATNDYDFRIGGDGFEVIWHATDPQKVIGGSQFNGIRRSTNGGTSFTPATTGMASDGPFITRLAGSATSPDVIYAIGSTGVYKSTNFGQSWTMKTITDERWDTRSASSSDVEVSLANDQIVWAGAGMADGIFNLFVSIDAGETYSPVNNYTPNPGAFYTGIYTHPTEENTAYALFSLPNYPKILKTTDLGQSWTDISGFEGSSNGSTRGFPDVFTHSLLVMPFNTDIIWAGTEIGLYESLDGGNSWNIRPEIPSVSIWSMKIVDEQVVIGTHGRGIWTATVSELEKTALNISSFTYLGYGEAELLVDLPVDYDQVKVMINGTEAGVVEAPANGNVAVSLSDYFYFDGADIQIVGILDGEELPSRSFTVAAIDAKPEILSFESSIEGRVYPVSIEMTNNEPFDKVEVFLGDELVYTDEQSLLKTDDVRTISFDYDQQATNRLQVKSYINEYVYTSNGEGFLVTANDEALQETVQVYPNPTLDYITISSDALSINKIGIFTANGVQVRRLDLNSNAKSTQIDVSSLDEGVYLVQVTGENGKLVSKRIIKR